MSAELIDIGANLTHESFTEDLNSVLDSASKKNVTRLIVTGADLQSSEAALELARSYPEHLFSTAGIHPHHAEDTNPEALSKLRSLLKNKEVKAVGETGLDFFRDLYI